MKGLGQLGINYVSGTADKKGVVVKTIVLADAYAVKEKVERTVLIPKRD